MKPMLKFRVVHIVGCNMRYYMRQNKLAFRDVHLITGISEKTLMRYATGSIIPKLDKALTIADCLGVDVCQIWSAIRE